MVGFEAGSANILLVDDDPVARKLYRAHLVAAGHLVAEAGGGFEAVEMTERESYGVVVMDLAMPGLDGWMAMSLIRARRPNLPIVVLTNSGGAENEKRAEQSGAAGFLVKPCGAELLLRAVAKALRQGS